MEVIREARLEDISDLAQLLEILFTQEKDFVPDRDKQSRGLELIIRTPEAGRVFVAVVDDEIVGMNSLLFSISTVEGRAVCWLEDVIIRPDRRGNGLGSRLMQHAIDYAKENGFARISVIADSDNHHAKHLYQKYGFQPSTATTLRLYL